MMHNVTISAQDIILSSLLLIMILMAHFIVDTFIFSKNSMAYLTRWRGIAHLLVDVTILVVVTVHSLKNFRYNPHDWLWFCVSCLAGLYAMVNAGKVTQWIMSSASDR